MQTSRLGKGTRLLCNLFGIVCCRCASSGIRLIWEISKGWRRGLACWSAWRRRSWRLGRSTCGCLNIRKALTCVMIVEVFVDFRCSLVVVFWVPHLLARILSTQVSHNGVTLSKCEVAIFRINNCWDLFHWVDLFELLWSCLLFNNRILRLLKFLFIWVREEFYSTA